MTDLGRYRCGDEVPVAVQVTTAAGAPAWPSAHPHLTAYDPAGDVAAVRRLPADRRGGATGRFGLAQFLGAAFAAAGRYAAVTSWPRPSGGVAVRVQAFEVVPGGHPDGPPISMAAVRLPDANRLIWQTAGGNLVTGLNPRVT